MDINSPDALFDALRDCGLYSDAQLAPLAELTNEVKCDPVGLADYLHTRNLLTGYQARKVRVNRIFELLVGQYLILDKVGEGGMGKVYKAMQLRMSRTVALKIVRSHLMTNKVVMRRYKREAAAAAALNHPNIVTLYDADEANNRHYLAMEYVEGSDLSRLVKECGALPYPEACEYMRQAALGLQHAHENGLIHRDIKPSNLLVSGERALPGTTGKALVKILDMGLVRSLTEDEDVSKTELTRDGTVVGTPDYMSPEQAKNSSTVDGRADLYSLGCTLFMMLTTKPPFPDGTPIDKLLRHQLDPHPNIRKKRPDVPPELAAVIDKMLAKKAAERYQTAAELAADLAAFTPNAVPGAPVPSFLNGPTKSHKSRKAIPEGSTAVTLTGPKKAVRIEDSPVAIHRPNTDSSESLPSADAIHIPRTTPPADDTTTGRGVPSRRAARAQARRRKAWLTAGLMAAGVIGIGILILGIVMASRGPTSDTAKSPPTSKVDGGSGKSAEIAKLAPPSISLPDAAANLPDNAVAALVVHPLPYFVRSNYDIKQAKHLSEALKRLQSTFAFDPQRFDRLTIGFPAGKGGGLVAVGEGLFTPTELSGRFDALPGAHTVQADGSAKLIEFTPPGSEPVYAAPLARRGYIIGRGKSAVENVLNRSGKQSASGLTSGLKEALPDPTDPNRAAGVFVADGQWTAPEIGTLAESGVDLAVVKVRMAEGYFDVEVTLVGRSKEKLIDFISLTLPRLYDRYPEVKPFILAVTQTENQVFETIGSQTKLTTKHGRWEYREFHEWMNAFLGSH